MPRQQARQGQPPGQLSTFRLGAPARAAPPAKSDHCTRASVARRVLPHQRLERRQHDRHAQIRWAVTTAFRLGHSPCRSVGAGVREDRAAPSASARHVAASCAHLAWYLEHCRFAATHRYDRSRVENGSALRTLKPTRMTISDMGDDFAVCADRTALRLVILRIDPRPGRKPMRRQPTKGD